MVLMKFLEWEWIEGLEGFVRTGEPLDVHAAWTPTTGACTSAACARRPASWATGSPVACRCRRTRRRCSTSAARTATCRWRSAGDTPAAVGRPRPARGGRAGGAAPGGRGDGRPGRASGGERPDRGSRHGAYDLILAFSLVHHFDAETNRALAARCARALRPGGIFVIGDLMRPEAPSGRARRTSSTTSTSRSPADPACGASTRWRSGSEPPGSCRASRCG